MKIKLIKIRPLIRKQTIEIIMRMFILLLCTTVFSLTTENTFSQEKIEIDTDKIVSVDDVLNIIQDQTEYSFFYPQDLFKNVPKVTLKKGAILLSKLLKQSLAGSNADFELSKNNTIVIEDNRITPKSGKTLSKQQVEIKGTVKDQSGQPLPGASIAIEGTSKGATTDIDGVFIIEVLDSNAILVISYIGYKTIKVPLNGKTTLSIILEEDASSLDVVLLTGIRASQQRAVAIKKNSVGFVDAITAESAGKLPDANVAEAMQRIAGVTISRTRGQGDFISIRGLGPEFARGSLNGRSLVSASTSRNTILGGGATQGTGRAANFDVLPADIIETIEVYKTSSAEHVEGGIGGSVNIKTVKPIDFGEKYGFNLRGTSFRGRDLSPSSSAYGSYVNDNETFGAFFTASYSNRLIREDAVRNFQYRTNENYDENVYFPFGSIPEVIKEDRERITASGTLQWKPSDKTNITVDGTYSRRNLNYVGHQAVVQADPAASSLGPDASTIVLTENGNLNSYSGLFPTFFSTDSQQATDDILSLGANWEQDLGNGWNSDFDISFSSTETDFSFQRSALRPPGNARTAYDVLIQDNIILPTSTDGTDFSDLSRYEDRGHQIRESDVSDSEFAIRLDISKDINSNFFSKFKTGLRYRNRGRETVQGLFAGAAADANGNALSLTATDAANAGVGFITGADVVGNTEFLGGQYTPGLYENFIWIEDSEAFREILESQGAVFTVNNDLNNTFNVDESTIAFYGQFDIDAKVGDFPLTGNIGARMVNTNISVTGNTQGLELQVEDPNIPNPVTTIVFTDNIDPLNKESSYFNFLPSANLKLQTGENTFLRGAYSKAITRPQFLNLGGYSINATNRIVNSAGNPELNPYKSTNYDIGMEWYTGGTGAIGITFFYKALSNFVAPVTLSEFTDLGVEWQSYTTVGNQGEGSISGTEISIQQPLKFLPGFLDGLGIIANFTFADGEQSLSDGTPIAFPGVSNFSFNSALYYDKDGKFQGRLAYTYRDKFLITAADVFNQELYNNEYGQLDASVSYKLTKGLTMYGEAINLTNSTNSLFSSNATSTAFNLERPTGFELTGTRLSFGIRGSF